jgi:hypothetical protein
VEIVSVNLADGTTLPRVYLGYKRSSPIAVTFSPDSSKAFVSIVTENPAGGMLIPIAPATGKRDGRPINLGSQPWNILVTR